ncbi:helicase-related protein [Rhodococcus erythropolis]|uniref:helicase-related protein n=1 Tax=Rhodococcus erythropolis TaxID=1833 RepID=UPI00083FCF61|nr:helicase-related protein [Rhodococcus erythropolis]
MPEDLTPWYEARSTIVTALEHELMGPIQAIQLDEPPLNRIIVGVLHPRAQTTTSKDEYRAGLAEDEALDQGLGRPNDEGAEAAVSLSHALKPASMGLTFSVNIKATQQIRVIVSARRYRAEGNGSWHPVDVFLPGGLTIRTDIPARIDEPASVNDERLRIVGVVRPAVRDLVRITISLVNQNDQSQVVGHTDEFCWFRPHLNVTAIGGAFVDRKRMLTASIADADARSASFLYRDEPTLAIGHGCAVMWDEDDRQVSSLSTTFLPSHDVRLASPSGGDESDKFGTYDLEMNELATSSDHSQLVEMVQAYELWINTRRDDSVSLHESHRSVALEHLALATQCAKRIRKGILALEDPQVNRAFRLMNESMVLQRNTQDSARGNTRTTQHWRPFQIAFILMNLPGLVDPKHDDRNVVDLLWFPTGGGKTEAYLGCIAFSILLRRIRRASDGGVSAIMRYTLRLLTRQQFERAAGLICALELIRRRELPQAKTISLGLWVGNQATPNKVEEARKILKQIASGDEPEGSTPVQLLNCPWCRTGLDHVNYDATGETLVISCRQPTCDFGDGLPLHVIDSDVYRERPSLVIGTVDKFAMMTWRSQPGSMFAVDGPDSRPDLIVQDELHLISGPLGTMVGLYESAVDLACTGQGRPKVLASTATIRRAEKQVRAVFDRKAVQFPPPGLDPSDNYFATEARPEDKGTRKYVGVMAPGTSQATLLVRLYSILLHSVHDLDVDDEVRDTYWTLLAYFNSLRVLGSTYLQVLDDIPDRLEILAERSGTKFRKISQEPVELTSRVNQTRIPGAMAALETEYPDPESPDIVLATNMISVGLDIDRLGLMVVAGQPQSTSEYIQSTSRVGRRHPGLVIVALNAQRSRDASHYESFIPFHRALYREVEATTATPFASRARDRGAHGMLVAAIRLLIQGLRGDDSVVEIAKYRKEIDDVIGTLVERATRVSPDEAPAFAEQLRGLVKTWQSAVGSELVKEYGALKHLMSKPKPGERPLMITAGSNRSVPESYPVRQPPWPTLTSMRDVDAETRLYVKYLGREVNRDGAD